MAVMCFLALILTGTYYLPFWIRVVRTARLNRILINDRALVLTFDDGPSPFTNKVLDLLLLRQAKATFFLLGRNAERYPEIVNRIMEEGHEVGCHSAQHFNALKVWPWKAVADTENGYAKLSRWVPANGPYRPPFGKMSIATYLCLLRRRAPIWWWTFDTGDTRNPLSLPEKIVHLMEKRGGGIVLMHDLDISKAQTDFVLATTTKLLDSVESGKFNLRQLGSL